VVSASSWVGWTRRGPHTLLHAPSNTLAQGTPMDVLESNSYGVRK
jgi:hypothetical protein